MQYACNDAASSATYTLSLHDALPILSEDPGRQIDPALLELVQEDGPEAGRLEIAVDRAVWSERVDLELEDVDRKSTRLNSSHGYISYAVFCLKKKNKTTSFRVLSES